MLKKKINFPSLILILYILLSGCATVPRTTLPQLTLQELCESYEIQWQWDPVSQIVSLKRGNLEAKALMGSAVVVIGGQRVTLSESLKRQKGTIIVPADFKDKIINRLASLPEVLLVRKKIFKIVVDAGHGGKDPGTLGRSGVKEKKIVLDIARRLKKNLEKQGFKVIMTREKDEFLSLEKRTEIASRSKADLFVSIHANSSPMRTAQGIEVFSFRDSGLKDRQEEQWQRNHQMMFHQLSMIRNDLPLERIIEDMLYRYKRYESQNLASYIVSGASQATKAQNRGIKVSDFFVLRNTLVPAILIEVGFLSNSKEENLLKTVSYRQKIADGIAESIEKYANR